jgi:hypothetical protein
MKDEKRYCTLWDIHKMVLIMDKHKCNQSDLVGSQQEW